jgi:PAS domain S-box-containing protein
MPGFHGNSSWMAMTLADDGSVRALSPSAERITGHSAAQVVGRPVTQLLGDRTVFEISRLLQSARDWGAWEGEVEHRDRMGRTFEGHGSLTLLAGPRGEPAGFTLVTLFDPGAAGDRTDGAPLHEIGAKLRSLAHEANNPLAVIMGFAQLIMLDPNCGGKIRADMEKLFTEVHHLIEVVERLHGYAFDLQRSEKTVPEVPA